VNRGWLWDVLKGALKRSSPLGRQRREASAVTRRSFTHRKVVEAAGRAAPRGRTQEPPECAARSEKVLWACLGNDPQWNKQYRVQWMQGRVQAGYYDQPEVRAKVVRVLMEHLCLH